jgi:hypothetical protein
MLCNRRASNELTGIDDADYCWTCSVVYGRGSLRFIGTSIEQARAMSDEQIESGAITRSSANTEPQLLLESGRPPTRICKRGHNKDLVGRHGTTCMVCFKLNRKPAHRRKWRETALGRVKRLAAINIRRARTRALMLQAKDKPCADCGIKYSPWVMDFDHKDRNTKYAMVSSLASSGRLVAMRREIIKCDVVCSNCHRERTHKQGF